MYFLIKHKCYFSKGSKSHQGSPDTSDRATKHQGKHQQDSQCFFAHSVFCKAHGPFPTALVQVRSPVLAASPTAWQAWFNRVFELLQKQKLNTPKPSPSRAEIGSNSTNHLIRWGTSGAEPSPGHCVAPRARRAGAEPRGRAEQRGTFCLCSYKLHHYACARWKERTNWGHPQNIDAGGSFPLKCLTLQL